MVCDISHWCGWLEREQLEQSLADNASIPLALPVPVAGEDSVYFYTASCTANHSPV